MLIRIKLTLLLCCYFTIAALSQGKDCLAYWGEDTELKKDRLDTKAALLFAYTSEPTKAYLPDRDLIQTQASITYISGGYYLLHLIIDVALANAPQAYGNIPAKSNLTIHFLDKSQATLKSAVLTLGTFQPAELLYRYRVEYPIGGNALKKLKAKELDRISLTWTTGIETYKLYDVDFFIRHFQCISQHQ
ncbi:MAG: hypothetical protein AAF847_19135 [Bacteroidota bacterium]